MWNASTTLADVTWAASADPDLKEYKVRAAPGEDYDADDEVVLNTGRERGSPPVYVTRPIVT
ncbi:hypothetical protein SAMN02745166_00626 [Prosthecobacter debontii]|uniref:Uncharacterized protein n=1 Tax=Prosthecobacter debontii TaxID=48467 RepID=A0A1T4WSU6_9BACT|nr:hypothetical protein [Prosthecobacter debontii]SKA80394.1 hypothetical protein SAMN02745166_00626 [Prosthecobacter debontii]